MKTRVVLLIVAILGVGSTLQAQIPQVINYQGRLDSTNGRPFNGAADITFTIYSDSLGSNQLWQETWQGIAMNNGMFTVFLGARTPFTSNVFAETGNRYLGIKVGSTGVEFSQRFRFGSVAYAIQSATVQDNAITTSKLADGTVTSAKIQDGAIAAADIANNSLVRSINSLKDNITLSAGSNITIAPTGNTLTISAGSVPNDPTRIPIGSIVAFYDFGTGGPGGRPLSFDTTYWVYCDGSTISDASSPLNGLRLPDLSNRYLVGFGTEGGRDIDIALWDTAAVGNASNVVNLAHSHTVSSHDHGATTGTKSLQTESGGSHNHLGGTSHIGAGNSNPAYNYAVRDNSGDDKSGNYLATNVGSTSIEGQHDHAISSELAHSHSILGHTHSISAQSPVTDNRLLTTQSIQPRSIQVRYIMRKR
jgi:hypothetical protein